MTATLAPTVTPIAGHIGAIVAGVDVTRPATPVEAEEILRLAAAHGAIFIRDQHLGPEDHIAFTESLGQLRSKTMAREKAGRAEVGVISTDNMLAYEAARWHTDSTSEEAPPAFCVLSMQTMPEVGGDTMWSSQAAAYDSLSDSVKELLAGLTATHGFGARHYAMNPGLQSHNVVHPVVVRQPRTGRSTLFVNPVYTLHINELSEVESRHLLSMLYEHSVRPEFTCRWRWQPGDVAIWNNPYVQHFAIHDYGDAKRKIHRAELAGEPMAAASA